MRKTLGCVLLPLVAAALWLGAGGAAGQSAATREGSRVETGRALFETYCASCHGRDGRGGGPVAAALKARPTDLTTYAAHNGGRFPSAQVASVIDGRTPRVRAHGPAGMPVWGDAFMRRDGLTDEAARARIEAIASFLETIQQRSGH